MPRMPTIAEAKESISKYVSTDKKGNEDWIKQCLEELKKSSGAKQVVVGTASGWVSGFIFAKFGRTAATAVGGTAVLLHLAQQYGYITIDWKRVNKDVNAAKGDISKKMEKEIPKCVESLKKFVLENVLLASGFGGGFLLGVASG